MGLDPYAPNVPPGEDGGEKTDDLDAMKKAVDDAASVGGGLWLSYLFLLFYLAVAVGAVTHADLFLEKPVKLPFLNIELPLLAFFLLAPILFIVVHAYTLVHLVFLTDKAKRFHQVLHDPKRNFADATRENLQWKLPSNIFVQLLAVSGPTNVHERRFRRFLWFIAWIPLAVAPVLLLLLVQVQFLPFHSLFINWAQRLTLLVDLWLIWWLWGKVHSRREVGGARRKWAPRIWSAAKFLPILAVILFAGTVATFSGEWQQAYLPSWQVLPAPNEWESEQPFRDWIVNSKKLSLHDWIFNSTVDPTTRRRLLPFSDTLVLTGFNVFEGLGIDDPEKSKWRNFVYLARGRNLKGAIFDFANLPRVDFTGADLQGASLRNAQLDHDSFDGAELRRASFDLAELEDASFGCERLPGNKLRCAKLQGARLDNANLQGASPARTSARSGIGSDWKFQLH